MQRRISSTALSGSCNATAPSAAKRVGCWDTIRAKKSFESTPVRPHPPLRPGSRTSLESAKAPARQRLGGPCQRDGHRVTNIGDRSDGREPHQISGSLGVAGALDAWPAVVRIGLPQIRQIVVDGVGVDIDEPWVGGSVSVDGHGSVQRVDRYRFEGRRLCMHNSRCVCIIFARVVARKCAAEFG